MGKIMVALTIFILGLFSGVAVEHQKAYCECFRDDFKGVYCEKIKKSGESGSCKSKQ
jgi:hypothetical protein